jgi:hydroxylamine reductase
MFCFQCQESAGGKGCTKIGVCGKKDNVANLQDLLIYTLKGLSEYNQQARAAGLEEATTNGILLDGLFATITNANFDESAISRKIENALKARDNVKAKLEEKGVLKEKTYHDTGCIFG